MNHIKNFLKALKYKIKTYLIKAGNNNIYLINTPEHGNLGDQMIAIATFKFLNVYFPNNNIVEITHDQFINAKNILKKKVHKNNLILIHGGGYLGDLWEKEQQVFCDIVEIFSENNKIAFPQTIYFLNKEKINYYFQKFKYFKNLYIVARENSSYDFLKNKFLEAGKVLLTPDIVLYHSQIDFKQRREGILFCMRTDKEKTSDLNDLYNVLLSKYKKVDNTDTVVDYSINCHNREKEVLKKLEQFSKYEVIITDRLHGMIFAYLSKTPCIAFDNVSKKVSGVYKWIENSNCIICNEKYDEKIVLEQIDYCVNLKVKKFENCQEKFDTLINLINISL